MLALIVVCAALSMGMFALVALQFLPRGQAQAVVAQRLDELQRVGDRHGIAQRRRRAERSDRLKTILQAVGGRVGEGRKDAGAVRHFLMQAGYTDAAAVQVYWTARVILGAGLLILGLTVIPLLGARPTQTLLGTLWLAALGWIGPTFYVRSRLRARQKEVQLALPDMLDMLIVCVEAGLGLNQALVRVADEIDHVSPVLSEHLSLTNLQIRAGTTREDALRGLAERTGVQDIRGLVAMLIQTDRFGTSIANALRIQADTLRTKRRQRAEEAAAKTTIKMVFPLVLFIFPAIFVVVLAPSVIGIMNEMAKVGR